jgi:hypothetical protein
VFVNLWHTFVKEDGVAVFWDSKVAAILPESPEFLHSRDMSPSGVAYEVDITESTMSLAVRDNSEALSASLPEGHYDRYYLFVDRTKSIQSFKVTSPNTDTVNVQLIPRGTSLEFQDRSYPVLLSAELKQDTILIELGPNTPLDDPNFAVTLDYERVESENPPEDELSFNSFNDSSSATSFMLGAATWLVVATSTLVSFLSL